MKITIGKDEFELVPINERYSQSTNSTINEGYTLKPVVEEKKTDYQLYFMNRWDAKDTDLVQDYNLTEETAQAISKAISELMEYITGEQSDQVVFNKAIIAARELYQDGS